VTFLTETNLRTKGSDAPTVAGALVRNIRFLLRVIGKGSKEPSDENCSCYSRRSFPRRHSSSS